MGSEGSRSRHGRAGRCHAAPGPGGQDADFAIVQAARVSYGEGTKQLNEDPRPDPLLARNRHTTPF